MIRNLSPNSPRGQRLSGTTSSTACLYIWEQMGTTFVARVVLLVDDEPLVCAVAAMMLEDLGCEVVTASDAADAREHDGRGFPLVRKPFLRDDLKRTMARHTGLC
jgi:hypothetical protein